jgi:bifunctional isochorismate lyase/aryl carrier protein
MSLPKLINYTIPNRDEIILNKVTWNLEINRAALLIHDMQEYFINSYSRKSNPIRTVIDNIKQIIMAARAVNIPIFYTAQIGNQDPKERALLTDFWGPGLSADVLDTSIIKELTPQMHDVCMNKWRYSAFKKSNFQDMLAERERNQLIIVGVYGHIGCLATALDAFMLDIKPFVPIDAIGDFSKEDHVMAASYITKRCGYLTDTKQILKNMSTKTIIPQTMQDLKIRITDCLHGTEVEIEDEAYLPDLGLDSIQIMQFAEQWQQLGINFLDLIQNPTPRSWLDLILNGHAQLERLK